MNEWINKTPGFDKELEGTLYRALESAKNHRHNYATLEHLLESLIEDTHAHQVMAACGVDIHELRDEVSSYIETELDSLRIPIDKPQFPPEAELANLSEKEIGDIETSISDWMSFEKEGPSPTSGFQRVIQRSILHVQSSGKDVVNGANVLVALFSERESYAVYFLQRQDISRLDAVSYISHGVGKSKTASSTDHDDYEVQIVNITSIARKLNIDLKTHIDEISKSPVLRTAEISNAIVDILLEIHDLSVESGTAKHENCLAALGIFGAWGTGKSTLLHAIANRFVKDGAVVVMINAWRWHGKESIYDFMNRELIKSLKIQKNTKAIFVFLNVIMFIRKNLKSISIFLSVISCIIILYKFNILNKAEYLPQIAIIKSLIAAASAATIGLFVKPIARILEKFFISSDSASDSEKLSRSYSYLNFSRKMGNIGKNYKKPIVFMFDDLDRCEPIRVVEFMQSIQRITSSGSISIVSCDDNFVKSAIYSHYKQIADISGDHHDFANNFLEKIIHFYYRISSINSSDLEDLGIKSVHHKEAVQDYSNQDRSLDNMPYESPIELVKDVAPSDEIGSVELSIICGEIIELFVKNYDVTIRKIKKISNIIKLYSTIIRPNEDIAYKIAVMISLGELDRKWIEKKFENVDNYNDFDKSIKNYLGEDKDALKKIAKLLGNNL